MATLVFVFIRRSLIAMVVNLVIAVGLAYPWIIVANHSPDTDWWTGYYIIWGLSSLAHYWYYSSEGWSCRICMTLASLGMNAAVLLGMAKIMLGQSIWILPVLVA
jgi:hypothetical protein